METISRLKKHTRAFVIRGYQLTTPYARRIRQVSAPEMTMHREQREDDHSRREEAVKAFRDDEQREWSRSSGAQLASWIDTFSEYPRQSGRGETERGKEKRDRREGLASR